MEPIEIVHVTQKAQLCELGSALTLEGLNTSQENLAKFLAWCEEFTPVKHRRVYVTSGATLNALYKLTGNNAYPRDLSIVSIDLADLVSPSEVALPRFTIGARWLDDIIDNIKPQK